MRCQLRVSYLEILNATMVVTVIAVTTITVATTLTAIIALRASRDEFLGRPVAAMLQSGWPVSYSG